MGGRPRAEPASVDIPWPAGLSGARVQRRLRSSPTSCCAVSPAPHLGVVALRRRLPRLRCPCVPAGAAPGMSPSPAAELRHIGPSGSHVGPSLLPRVSVPATPRAPGFPERLFSRGCLSSPAWSGAWRPRSQAGDALQALSPGPPLLMCPLDAAGEWQGL